MDKKLIAKVQQLTPTQNASSNQLSDCVIINQQEKETILKKGRLYSVYEVSGNAVLDTPLVSNIIKDVLRDSYYQSENVSPIQSLEKAIYDVNEKVTKLSVQSIGIENPEIELNIIASVLWGNVLYVVQFGKGQGYLMRGTQVKKLNLTTEGNYSVSSGVIQDEDVVILATEKFAQKFPPEVLLKTSVSTKDLDEKEACLILKLNVDTSFTEEELIDFKLKSNGERKFGRAVHQFIKSLAKGRKVLAEDQQSQPIDTLAVPIKIKKSLGPRFKFKPKLTMIIVLVLLGASVVFTLYKNPRKERQETVDGTSTQTPEPVKEAAEDQTVFYDIKLADDTANPTELALVGDIIAVTDSGSGKIFTSSVSTPKFEAEQKTFAGIKDTVNSDGDLGFVDNEGYKEYKFDTGEIINTLNESLGLTETYLGSVYSLQNGKITKYTNSNGEFAGAEWITDDALAGAKDMDIAYGIYVITADRNLVSYVSGEKTDFSITGLEGGLADPIKIVVNIDFENIYVADRGLKAIAVFSENGNFVKLIRPGEGKEWGDIRDFDVNADESKLYVLNGSKVHEVTL